MPVGVSASTSSRANYTKGEVKSKVKKKVKLIRIIVQVYALTSSSDEEEL